MGEVTRNIKFPPHKGGLYIEHNPHLGSYMTIEKYFEDGWPNFKSESVKQKCLEQGSIWVVQWYPDTPIGSYQVAAPTFEEALQFANEISEVLHD